MKGRLGAQGNPYGVTLECHNFIYQVVNEYDAMTGADASGALNRAVIAQIDTGLYDEHVEAVSTPEISPGVYEVPNLMNDWNSGQTSGGNQPFNRTPGSMWRMGVSINGINVD